MGVMAVTKAGQLSLVQDFGRYGCSQLGLTQGGPVDDYAFSWANYLLGNDLNAAAIEITLGQALFTFEQDAMIAICGGDLQPRVNQIPVANWSRHWIKRGQTLSFSLPRNGLRAYLAINGGFKCTPHFGSASTVQREMVGGRQQDGSALEVGDQVEFSDEQTKLTSKQVTFRFIPDYNLPLTLRVIESYQNKSFHPDSLRKLYSGSFSISQNSNRMGYRLEGDTINPPSGNLISEGIALGSIQVPPDGNPIILLNDRQTLGGYPKLGCVARIDLPRLAQAKPGQKIQFVKGDLEGLQKVWCKWARFFGY
ncbi:5-oxoprolinase subunit C family protein [Vibrio nigripulchritudo]|uniref:5-oxoprolinase subunit C family protein n=1 Tax=Vibrio nigripulchritudo TaxID=28173 RepID=UPI002491A323|nr:biotin-dependent carboxyltransferase family protein [Vibrio nigripulchritudo]BDU40112.1 allophanate hydrolase [Vibrio nigripulchritudo]BDU45836.1 allophanate hydrolase [Vibrio nigripulchritudo]